MIGHLILVALPVGRGVVIDNPEDNGSQLGELYEKAEKKKGYFMAKSRCLM